MAVKLIDELQKEIKAAGEAVKQEAYEKAYDHVFQILDNLEKLLNDNRYLEGNEITEEDKRLRDYDNLWAYARDLYQTPGFGDTTDFAAIKKHYHIDCNPGNIHQIIAKGPDEEAWLLPHGREKLSEK